PSPAYIIITVPRSPRAAAHPGAPARRSAAQLCQRLRQDRVKQYMATKLAESERSEPRRRSLDSVVIRFAGDSGDGMQLTGTQFTQTTALAGNDLATFPDFPAEIRAPAGSLAGVSGFQVHISSQEVFTPGDEPDVLVAMNP